MTPIFMDVMDFTEAIKMAKTFSDDEPTVLLGNGFSMAYDREIFSYEALFSAAADWDDEGRIRSLFDQIGTWDFELVIRKLEAATDVIKIYQHESALAKKIQDDTGLVRRALINAISRTHPDNIFSVDQSRMRRAVNFLRNFSRVYSR